jgi:hypothetical protein
VTLPTVVVGMCVVFGPGFGSGPNAPWMTPCGAEPGERHHAGASGQDRFPGAGGIGEIGTHRQRGEQTDDDDNDDQCRFADARGHEADCRGLADAPGDRVQRDLRHERLCRERRMPSFRGGGAIPWSPKATFGGTLTISDVTADWLGG